MSVTETLSGLDLRIAVAKKLGFLPEVNESLNIEIGNDGRTWEPGTRWSITNGSYAYLGSDGTVESAWRTVPAFESDLGALQSSGVISAICSADSFVEIHGTSIRSASTSEGVEVWRRDSYAFGVTRGGPGKNEVIRSATLATGGEALATALCLTFLAMSPDA